MIEVTMTGDPQTPGALAPDIGENQGGTTTHTWAGERIKRQERDEARSVPNEYTIVVTEGAGPSKESSTYKLNVKRARD